MFGNKKNTEIAAQVETLIGQSTTVKGSLSSNGALRIDGKFEGDIATTADIIVGESGVIAATVAACPALRGHIISNEMPLFAGVGELATVTAWARKSWGRKVSGLRKMTTPSPAPPSCP